MIHCADRANAQRIRMPDAVRAELYVTPARARAFDGEGIARYTAYVAAETEKYRGQLRVYALFGEGRMAKDSTALTNTAGRLPDFIIAGAMKSGTSTLHYILADSPSVFIPDREIHFFDIDNILQHPDFFVFTQDQWWVPQFAEHQEKYLAWYSSFFEAANKTHLIGEDSTTYLASPQAPERIARLLPDVKIIIMLRNPASRAYSQYWHMLRTGRAIWNFEDTLQIEPGTIIERSLYKQQIERFLAFIPSEQIHFILFEEFVSNLQSGIREVCQFLKLDVVIDITQINTHRNPAAIPRYPYLKLWYNRIFRWQAKSIYFQHLPHTPRQTNIRNRKFSPLRLVTSLHHRINPTRPGKPPPMKPQTRTFLNSYFARENTGLSELIGKDVEQYWYLD
jgi:hypothetical protein